MHSKCLRQFHGKSTPTQPPSNATRKSLNEDSKFTLSDLGEVPAGRRGVNPPSTSCSNSSGNQDRTRASRSCDTKAIAMAAHPATPKSAGQTWGARSHRPHWRVGGDLLSWTSWRIIPDMVLFPLFIVEIAQQV